MAYGRKDLRLSLFGRFRLTVSVRPIFSSDDGPGGEASLSQKVSGLSLSLCAGLGPGAGGGNGSLLHVHDGFAALSCVSVPSGAGVRPSDPCGLHFLPARPPFILRPPDVHARGSNPPFGIPASSNLVNVVEHNLITHFSSRLTGMWGGTAPHSLHLCGSLSWPGFLSVVPTLSPRPVAPTFDDLLGGMASLLYGSPAFSRHDALAIRAFSSVFPGGLAASLSGGGIIHPVCPENFPVCISVGRLIFRVMWLFFRARCRSVPPGRHGAGRSGSRRVMGSVGWRLSPIPCFT